MQPWIILNPSIQSSFFEDVCFHHPTTSYTTNHDIQPVTILNESFNEATCPRQAMYDENCFEVGSSMPRGRFASDASMCYEDWHRDSMIGCFLRRPRGPRDEWILWIIVNVSCEHLDTCCFILQIIQYAIYRWSEIQGLLWALAFNTVKNKVLKDIKRRWWRNIMIHHSCNISSRSSWCTTLQERVLYRLLSGWHASTSISIAKNYYAPGTFKGFWHCMLGQ